jgi:hypothetical protein
MRREGAAAGGGERDPRDWLRAAAAALARQEKERKERKEDREA